MTGTVAIVVIGDEVLEGSTTDINSGWLCRQVTGRGARITQICTVPDDHQRIGDALWQSFTLGPDLVITVGGLGPTRDDLTLEAIGKFAGVALRPHEDARRMVERRYEELFRTSAAALPSSAETGRARAKMALLPEGGVPIPNEVGVAPAVHLTVGNTGILALPGVPREMKHIVAEGAVEVFLRWLGVGCYGSASVITSTNDESVLDAALREFDAEAADDGVYLKSRARRFGQDVRVTVTLSVRGTELESVRLLLLSSLDRLKNVLSLTGIDVLEELRDSADPASRSGGVTC